jgi:hypothetical protein
MSITTFTRFVVLAAPLIVLPAPSASAQPMAKAQVANLIVKVENGVDDFKKYLERRGENAQTAANNTNNANRESGKRRAKTATQTQKAAASERKDELEDSLDELNRSTNRLRRKFDATDKWIETKAEVERMIDDGRKINQAITRGNYGTEAARLWGVLRTGMNDLARAYNVTPLGV